MAAPNIAALTSITGKTVGFAAGTGASTVITCPSDKVLKINSIVASNIDGTNNADVSVSFYDSGTTTSFKLAHNITVPAQSSLVVTSKDAGFYLEEGDQITASASAAGDIEIVVSYDEIDDA
jgi:hypothetical protein